MADEFYILLDGEVGIFPLRLDDVMLKELKVIEQVREVAKQAQFEGEITSIQILKIPIPSLSPEESKLVSSIRTLTSDSVVFSYPYLQEKLGELPEEMLYNEIFYNSVS